MRASLLLLFFAFATALVAQQAVKTGPAVGSMVPSFETLDQNGRLQNLKTITGPNGAVLVFVRSADW